MLDNEMICAPLSPSSAPRPLRPIRRSGRSPRSVAVTQCTSIDHVQCAGSCVRRHAASRRAALVSRCRCRGCRPAARRRQVRLLPQPTGTMLCRRAWRSSMSSSSSCRSCVDAQGPWPRCSAGVRAIVQSRTQHLMDRVGEHLAVLIRKAAEVRQEARRPDVLHSSGPRSASSASIESYTFLSGTSSPGRDGYRAS
jgi:hypothetical protein